MAKTKDKRPPIAVPLIEDLDAITTFEDVDVALGAMRLADARIATLSAEFDVQIQQLQEAKQAAAKPFVDRQAKLALLLEAFCTTNKDAVAAGGGGKAKGRSRKFVHGVVGFRIGTPKLVLLQELALVIKMLKVRGHDECVVPREDLDKEAVKRLPPAEQRYVGVRVDQDDTFYYKLNVDRPVDYPEVAPPDDGLVTG